MSDVNRDPIRWERSMTQDKDGQYVSYHDYAVLLESYEALRAELAALQAQVAEAERQEPVAHVRYNKTGGNAGIAWHAEPTGVMPRDGEPLYARPVQHPAITHCSNCGCDWLDNGLNPVGCPYCKPAAVPDGWVPVPKEAK